MKKVTIFLAVIMLLALTVVSAFAFSGIQFLVVDDKTSQPWGTASGQSYRIYVSGSVTGTLLDTTVLTTPGDPTLDFTCNYGAACPPGSSTILTAPASGETVSIYMILTGTNDNPTTIIDGFIQPSIDLGTYTINRQSGTGPTAVTLQNVTADNNSTAVGIGFVVLMLAGVTFVMLRRREVA